MTTDLSAPVIDTENLCKVFGRQRALDNVTLCVRPGAIGLLGPNGAGKSTFMKCLLQLQPITSGSAKLLGREVGLEGREIRTRVGFTPEQDCHIPGMVGCEYITYCAQLSGLPFEVSRQRAHEMLDFVDEVSSGVDQVASAISIEEGIGEAINELVDVMNDANTTYGHREEAILRSGTYEDL